MRRYRIDGIEFAEDAPELANALGDAFARKLRPLCLCRPDGVPMYITRFDGQHLVKRMPSSGGSHDPSCGAYQPPYELSGLGPLIGDAIRLDEENGIAALRLDFPLARTGSRLAPAAEASAPDTVKNVSKRLSLRALLHYLWQEGELTEWTAAWAGKRGWGRVRASLVEAARRMTVSTGSLSETLFVPEVFHQEEKSAIPARRAPTLAVLANSGTGKRKLMVLVGEVKEFAEARSGRRLIIKHMPDYPLVIEEGAWKRLEKTFATEFAFWNADSALHLVTILTFGLNAAGLAVVEEMALMITTENWIPFETEHERLLLERLARLRRKSVKGLRFNLSSDKPVVSVTLPEMRPDPLAMFIVPADADEAHEIALAGMIEARPEIRVWIWRVGDGDMPRLP
jgi:hypothetical protein